MGSEKTNAWRALQGACVRFGQPTMPTGAQRFNLQEHLPRLLVTLLQPPSGPPAKEEDVREVMERRYLCPGDLTRYFLRQLREAGVVDGMALDKTHALATAAHRVVEEGGGP